ncbi:MAG: hypothetical protein KJO08_09430 [Gammaproteobacteria bacterium]|nr:hypothetical protein [Gammaproteobacteria bacterium]NNJ84497.1 hypothetical protein [Gammaproteobacteria bacterium]
MTGKTAYWIGKKPWDGKRWAYTTSGIVLDDPFQKEEIFRMYRRYVRQWNEIELNMDRSLSEHTHEVCGAKVVGGNAQKFILHMQNSDRDTWILEVNFARGFSEFYPGLSCARNTMRSPDDIRSIHLHWSQAGNEAFKEWLKVEKEINETKGEWTEYKAS